ncbi:MAG: DNA-directed RNA polymerase subunit omega [Paludibacteraceae bacterium]|nr:DNA-directed RNA polymerase subunit omega [Paludibacteraceae bacterium]
MDYKKSKAPKTTVTRDLNQLTEPVGNVYETIAILGKRANQISGAIKKELDAKLQDFSIPQDALDETFENKEQIEISRTYERMPKATLIATQELIDGELVYRTANRDDILK